MNFIYITTNLINGKQYVGSHKGDENDSYLGSGTLFCKKINEYGRENFKRKIIEECDPSMNLILETKYIKKYKTHVSQGGYNISRNGGLGLPGECWGNHTEESKLKISKSSKTTWKKWKENNYDIIRNEKISKKLKGRIKTNEWIEKWRINVLENKTFEGEKNPMFGKTQSKETREKISMKNKGNSNCGGRKDKTFAIYEFYRDDIFIETVHGQQNAKVFCKNNKISFQSLCKKDDKWKNWYCKRNRK
jgi:group I intron endonuclease